MDVLFDDLPNDPASSAPPLTIQGGTPMAPNGTAAAPPSAMAASLFDDLPNETSGPTASAGQGTTADLASLAANGAVLGFGPRIAAAGDTAVNTARGWLGYGPMDGTSSDYASNLTRYQDMVQGAGDRHPIAGTVAGIAGAAANPATYLIGPEELAATLGGKIVQGAGIGAGFGAAQGVGDSRDLTNLPDVAKNVGIGAGVGAMAGGALPVLARGYSGLTSHFGSSDARAPLPGMNQDASDFLMRKYQADGPDAVQARAQQLGPDGMLLDAGPNMFGTAMGVAATPGDASTQMVRALNIRGAGTNARVGADVDAALGPAQNPGDVRGAIGDTQDALTAPLYQDAYGQGQRWTPGLDAISQRPAVQSALQDAGTAAANKGTPLPSILLDEQGQPISSHAALEAYEARTRPAMDQAVADYLGSDGSIATAARIMADRKAAADPLYAQFRASNIPMTPELQELLQRPSVRAALPGAERLAQDEGTSIYLKPQEPQWEPDPVPSGFTPDAPTDMTFGPTDNGVRGAAPQRPEMPPPQSLHDFVKSLGGVQDPHGDFAAMGLADVPGLVARPGTGLGPDAVRQLAAEQGYLGAHIDGAMANTSINDLHDAMSRSAPVYSVRDQGAVDAWDRYAVARDAWEGQGRPNSRSAMPGRTPGGLFDMGGPPQEPAPVRQIKPEGWDYVARSLGDKISSAQRAGLGNEARIATNLRSELMQHLDAASPVYREARQAYAGHSQLLDALQAGHGALKNNLTREQMAADFGGLGTDGERQMYRLGAAHALREQMAQTGDGRSFVGKIAGNQAMRDKLAVLAPSPEHAARFNGRLDQARQSFTEATRPTVEGWHNTLLVLDNKAKGQSGPQQAGTQASADALRGELGQIPSFARAQQIEADYGRLGAALDGGRQVLGSGSNAMHPADYAASFGAMSPAEQAANRIGLRADIDRNMGVRSNDHQAIKGLLQGEDGWNGAKIATAFGPDAQAALNHTIDREGTFAESRNRIVQNSKTEPTRQAVADLKGEPWEAWVPFKDRVADASVLGTALDLGVRKPINALVRALQTPPDLATRDAHLADALTRQSAAKSELLGKMDARQRAAMAQLLASDNLQEIVSRARAPAASAMARALLEYRPDDQRSRR